MAEAAQRRAFKQRRQQPARLRRRPRPADQRRHRGRGARRRARATRFLPVQPAATSRPRDRRAWPNCWRDCRGRSWCSAAAAHARRKLYHAGASALSRGARAAPAVGPPRPWRSAAVACAVTASLTRDRSRLEVARARRRPRRHRVRPYSSCPRLIDSAQRVRRPLGRLAGARRRC